MSRVKASRTADSSGVEGRVSCISCISLHYGTAGGRFIAERRGQGADKGLGGEGDWQEGGPRRCRRRLQPESATMKRAIELITRQPGYPNDASP